MERVRWTSEFSVKVSQSAGREESESLKRRKVFLEGWVVGRTGKNGKRRLSTRRQRLMPSCVQNALLGYRILSVSSSVLMMSIG